VRWLPSWGLAEWLSIYFPRDLRVFLSRYNTVLFQIFFEDGARDTQTRAEADGRELTKFNQAAH
jgi:hypothetical protein